SVRVLHDPAWQRRPRGSDRVLALGTAVRVALLRRVPDPGFLRQVPNRPALEEVQRPARRHAHIAVERAEGRNSFAQAIDTVAKNAVPPIGDEFGRAVREMNLGGSPDEALSNITKRIASQDFDLVATAYSIHRTVGGNLAEILDNIAYTIRERVRIKGEIQTLTAHAKASGTIT